MKAMLLHHRVHVALLVICTFLSMSRVFGQSANCATATPITLTSGTACVNGTNSGIPTTIFTGSGCPGGSMEIAWYTYTANGSNNSFTVTPGTMTNATIFILFSCPAPTYIIETCAQATGSNPVTTSWGTTAGQQVYICVASSGGTDGTFQLCVNSQAPAPGAGNTCAQSIPICNMNSFNVPNVPSNSSGQNPNCFLSPPQQDIWYTFTITQSGTLAWRCIPNVGTTEFDWCLWDVSAGCPGTVACCNYHYATGSSGGFGMQTIANSAACGIQTIGGPVNREYSPPIAVTCGQTYAIQISNYANNNTGYTFDWNQATCTIGSTAMFSATPTLVCGASLTAAITNSSTGDCAAVWNYGDGSATYTGSTPPNHTYNTPGTYAITETIGGACASNHTEFVQLLAPLAMTATSTTLNCSNSGCVGTGSVTSISGGDGIYTYNWAPSGGSSSTASGLCSGIYTVTVSNAKCGTSVSQTVNVAAPPALTLTPTPSNATCGSSNGSISVSASGGTAGYSYNINGGAYSGTTNYTGLGAGTYTMGVQDSHGCTTTQTVSITQGGSISVIVNSPSICNGGSVNLNASGATSYNWSPGTGLSATTGSTVVANPSSTTVYTITGTSGSCTTTSTSTVTVNSPPSATASAGPQITCSNLTTTVNATPASGVSYSWSGPGIVSGGTTATPTVNSPGVYTVTVTDNVTTCTATATATVTTNGSVPTATTNVTGIITCTNVSTTVESSTTPGTGITYTWTGPGIVSGASTGTITVNAAGVYTLNITDNSNGCTAVTTATVSVNNTPPSPVASAGPQIDCANLTTTVTTTPASGVTYSWSGTGIVSGGTTATPTVNAAGVYTVTVTDNTNGCTATATATVTTNGAVPTATATAAGQLTCSTNTTTINSTTNPSTGITYSWSGPGIVSGGTTGTVTVNAPGVYTLTITDQSNGCSGVTTETVALNGTLPTVTASNGPQLTCIVTTTTLNATPASGVTYSWSGPGIVSGGTTSTPTVNAAGVYTVTVTDNTTGCSNTATATVSLNNTQPSPTASAGPQLTCVVNSTTVNATPGSGVTYSWSGPGIVSGGTTATPTVNTAGVYTVTVTDNANGCTNTATTTVTLNNTQPSAAASAGPQLTCVVNTTTLNATPASGVTYSWAGAGIVSGGTSASPTVNAPGIFTVTVTDNTSGCTNVATATVTSNTTTPVVTASASSALPCAGTATAGVVATSTVAGATYSWSGPGIVSGGSSANATVNATGVYTVTITDQANGCTSTDTANVTQVPSPGVSGNATPTSASCGNLNGSITGLSGSGGTPTFTYQWVDQSGQPVGNAANLNNVGPGTYSLIVTDQNMCSDTAGPFTVGNIPSVVASFTANPSTGTAPLNVQFTDQSLNATIYNWTFGTGAPSTQQNPGFTYSNTGTYTVTLIASNGTCSDTAMAIIIVDSPSSIVIPNIYSPNGDGLNDIFSIQCVGISTLTCDIFNRWGQKVYVLNGPNDVWDGHMLNGNNASEGTYYFVLVAKGADGQSYSEHGNITLVK